MKQILYYLALSLLLFFVFSSNIDGQDKEYEKLKDLVEKDKLEKAREYCEKVTAPLAPKTSARFFALMGNAYFNKKDYPKAAEMLTKSEDRKLASKLAKEFENNKNDFYDVNIAIKLHKIANEFDRAAELLFQEKKYEEAAHTCQSPDVNMKFGKQLFYQGNPEQALFFFKRAKKKGQKFSNDTVLGFYYNKKAYRDVYTIQGFGEGGFYLPIQGSVIDKMLEYNEPISFISHFLDSIGIKGNKQDEAILNGMVNNKLADRAENYCLELKNPNQQVALAFLADICADKLPALSAWANLKTGKTILGKQQITSYLTETAKEYHNKWDTEPIDLKLLEAFSNQTKPLVQKCGQDFCEFARFAQKMSTDKMQEYLKSNKELSDQYSRGVILLKYLVQKYCK